jgi:tetratricopeptide (TPR) repeat protein
MSHRAAYLILALLSGLLARPAAAAPLPPAELGSSLESALVEVEAATSGARLDDAERLLATLAGAYPDAPAVVFERARLLFHQGRYAEAVAQADRALSGARGQQRRGWQAMRDLMHATLEVTRDFAQRSSPDGRYVVSYPPGKDVLLAGYTLEVLAAADQALSRIFAVELPAPIRLEIYPTAKTLADVSALTVEQIETTGTVALSKWNRLMITSPRALVRGYPWADTICHELVHLVLTRLTSERAPVWLQEGTAKLYERAWRTDRSGLLLDPSSLELLRDAHQKGKLLTFQQMHPSIAMLPSEDDAVLAFAQVATFMDSFVSRFGEATLRKALAEVAEGEDAREALGYAAGESFAKLEAGWRQTLQAEAAAAPVRALRLRFRVGDGPTDESREVTESDARRFMRIGDLLWDRGRSAAAAREYEKAHRVDPADPIVTSRWARAALQSGNPQAVIEALEPMIGNYPGHAPAHALLGAARAQLGERQKAVAPLRDAIWINPFDPAPHCDLARVSEDPDVAQHEQSACDALR